VTEKNLEKSKSVWRVFGQRMETEIFTMCQVRVLLKNNMMRALEDCSYAYILSALWLLAT